jgi:uncharacterized membrane protein
LGFIALSKTNKHFFMIILLLLGLLYIIHLKKTIDKQNIKNSKQLQQINNKLDSYISSINYIILLLLVIGFILYIGEKKIEYGNNFNYSTFLFGNPNCKGYSPDVNFITAFQKAFTP